MVLLYRLFATKYRDTHEFIGQIIRRKVLLARLLFGVCLAVTGVLFCPFAYGAAQPVSSGQVQVASFPDTQTIKNLSVGGVGDGYILFFLSTRGVTRPALVVHITHKQGASEATAEIYQAPRTQDYVSYSRRGDTIVIPDTEQPAIIMHSLDGRWITDGHADVNLHVDIYSPFQAMWEPADIRKIMYPKGKPANAPRQVVYTIDTRAYSNGTPEWDLRKLVPSLTSSALLRTNYAQRMKQTSLTWQPSVFSPWPYVAVSGGFTQSYGLEHPPIVVDWNSGRLLDFSEVVSLRSEANGYGLYSLDSLPIKHLSQPNFESPWGFYNLSSQPSNYPNLVIRTQHNPAHDPYYRAYGSLSISAPLYPYPSEDVRYTWADHPGNLLFNYKVDVYGTVPYTTRTSIASGGYKILAPDFYSYPKFVVGHRWPIVTFVDTEGRSYATSEGLYDWPASSVGLSYLRGWTPTPSLAQFQTIRTGFRGEYRVRNNASAPQLYLSPVDHQWHLLGAQGGLWNLGAGYQLQEQNLANGDWIDDWKLTDTFGLNIQEFAHLDGWSLYTGPEGSSLVKDSRPGADLITLPPFNHQSWTSFVQETPPTRTSWAKNLSTLLPKGVQIDSGLTIKDVTATSSGLQFTLWVSQHHSQLNGLFQQLIKRPGTYEVNYISSSKSWHVSSATPASIQISRGSSIDSFIASTPIPLEFSLKNTGDLPWDGYVEVKAESHKLLGEEVVVPGHSTVRLDTNWTPTSGLSNQTILCLLNGQSAAKFEFQIKSQSHTWEQEIWKLGTFQSRDLYYALIMFLVLVSIAYVSLRRIQG